MVLIRGGGDLASGVVLRLFRAGLRVVVTEVARPLAVRRTVSFAQVIYQNEVNIEEVKARLVETPRQVLESLEHGILPVIVDPPASIRQTLRPIVLVDARMTKRLPDLGREAAEFVVGLGPGFVAGENCHAVVETVRGPFLGRVIWQGSAEPDTGLPDTVANHQADRVLRAPADGIFQAYVKIGDTLEAGQVVAEIDGKTIRAPFKGILRGLIQPGLQVSCGLKVGDIDPRLDPRLCGLVSDKALAVGGGVMEAIMSYPELRKRLWS